MQRYSRSERVSELIQEIIAETIRQELDDPRILPVTITRVRVSRDLRLARVFYSLSGDAEAKSAAQQGLEKAAGLFKKVIDHELNLRFMPELAFQYDQTLDQAERIEKILKEVLPPHGTHDPEDP
jgi:ribosome-binding factor A